MPAAAGARVCTGRLKTRNSCPAVWAGIAGRQYFIADVARRGRRISAGRYGTNVAARRIESEEETTVNSGIYTAYSGLRAQMNALDILSNNLANANTTGFKEEKPFYTLLNQSLESSAGGELGSVINNQAVLARGSLNFSNGALQYTGRDLDVALTGSGFLSVQAPQGVRYTRNGSLILNARSVLCTPEGFPVLGENGPITLGRGKILINEEGDVYLDSTRIDRLKMAAFDNPAALLREGDSLVVPAPDQKPAKATGLQFRQGYLEQSNVNPVSAVVGMVGIMRNFESIQKSFNLLMNDVNAKAIERLGR